MNGSYPPPPEDRQALAFALEELVDSELLDGAVCAMAVCVIGFTRLRVGNAANVV